MEMHGAGDAEDLRQEAFGADSQRTGTAPPPGMMGSLPDELLDGIDAVLWEMALPGPRFLYVSRAAEDILGYPVDQWTTPPGLWPGVLDDDGRARWDSACRACADSSDRFDFDCRATAADGRAVWLHAVGRQLRDAGGQPVSMRGVLLDITRRKAAELTLRESERRFRLLADSVPDQMWTAGSDGQLDWVNARVVEYFGRPAREIIGAGWQAVIHPDDLPSVLDRWGRSLLMAAPYEVEFRLRRADGEYRTHIGRALPQHDGGTRVLRWFGTNTDVEAQRRAERALEAREERERFLAEASRLLASSFDYRVTLRALAQLAVPTLGDFCFFDVLGDDGLVRRVAWRHVDEQVRPWYDEVQRLTPPMRGGDHPVTRALSTGAPQFVPEVTGEWMERASTGPAHLAFMRRLAFGSLMTVPLRVEHRMIGAMTFCFAGSGRRYTEADLALAESLASRTAVAIENARLYEQVSSAVQARDDLASFVSHDLRNPLNTILMAAGTLLEIELPAAQQQRHLQIIRRSAHAATRLLEDLLDVSRIEAGRLVVEPEVTPLRPIIEEKCEELTARAAGVGVTLAVESPEPLPPVVVDRTRIAQVLANLIANAIKFTPPGRRVVVSAARDEEMVRVTVRDEGVGIAADDLPHVFDRFWQARRASRAGAGLGLAIAKGIVEAHGGRIGAESEEGHGSTFWFTVPARAQGAAAQS